ncbi:Tkp4 protein [Vanderwaltozyma polyspora DSM 70294]|uniref:Tkp4 protein n=1 Tax=Vanderwaltozyma polyspora (strain ATCC 22028 / DSM 70294 / BCRC 21397 / CBS 2163 / NBRC 10782 / NRRL Y-8283 / UCD 57-17) TaxID=436907 RepID=A7TGU1_VANPO|nr:Tkp4 protein [Vanderwaltozyma polyspora DSM 70294]EDO18554.1 Tkp4 protein [Vanderwaltozyma polyspora DSM 70294]
MSLQTTKPSTTINDSVKNPQPSDSLHGFPARTPDEDLIHESTGNSNSELVFKKIKELEDEFTKLLLSPRSKEIIEKRQAIQDEISDLRTSIKVLNELSNFEDLAESNNSVTMKPSSKNNKQIGFKLVNNNGEEVSYMRIRCLPFDWS